MIDIKFKKVNSLLIINIYYKKYSTKGSDKLAQKRYYWLKLPNNFFNLKEIKKLRKMAGGDTFTIIYLKLQLLSLKDEGKLFFDGIEDTFIEEMALEIDEEVDNVKFTIIFLEKCGLLEEVTEDEYLLPKVKDSVGSETAGAERVRRHRAKEKTLQCNTIVTDSNSMKHLCNVEKEIDKDIDIEKEREEEKELNSTSILSFPTEIHKLLFNQFGTVTYETWFMDSIIKVDGNLIKIEVDSQFKKDLIAEKFIKIIGNLTHKKVSIKIKGDELIG